MSVAGFFLLLGIAIVVRRLGFWLIPLAMPQKRLKTWALGWLGGLAGSLLDRYVWHIGPRFVEIQVGFSAIGCAVFILVYGLWPFFKILVGNTGMKRA